MYSFTVTSTRAEKRELSRIAKDLLGDKSCELAEDELNERIFMEAKFQEKLRHEYTDYFFDNIGTENRLSFSEWSLRNYPPLN